MMEVKPQLLSLLVITVAEKILLHYHRLYKILCIEFFVFVCALQG